MEQRDPTHYQCNFTVQRIPAAMSWRQVISARSIGALEVSCVQSIREQRALSAADVRVVIHGSGDRLRGTVFANERTAGLVEVLVVRRPKNPPEKAR